MISPSQRPLPDNTQHAQHTNFHAVGGIRTHDLSRRADVDRAATETGTISTLDLQIPKIHVLVTPRQVQFVVLGAHTTLTIPLTSRKTQWLYLGRHSN